MKIILIISLIISILASASFQVMWHRGDKHWKWNTVMHICIFSTAVSLYMYNEVFNYWYLLAFIPIYSLLRVALFSEMYNLVRKNKLGYIGDSGTEKLLKNIGYDMNNKKHVMLLSLFRIIILVLTIILILKI